MIYRWCLMFPGSHVTPSMTWTRNYKIETTSISNILLCLLLISPLNSSSLEEIKRNHAPNMSNLNSEQEPKTSRTCSQPLLVFNQGTIRNFRTLCFTTIHCIMVQVKPILMASHYGAIVNSSPEAPNAHPTGSMGNGIFTYPKNPWTLQWRGLNLYSRGV